MLKTMPTIWEPVFFQLDAKNVTVEVHDGASHSIEVKLGEGNITFDETRNVEYTLDRGRLDEVRLGNETPMSVSLDAIWEYLKGNTSTTTNVTVEDALKQRGGASNWTSSDSDDCRPYAVDIILKHVPACTGHDKEQITLADFRYESANHNMKDGTLSFSGKCNVTEADIVRVSSTSTFGA